MTARKIPFPFSCLAAVAFLVSKATLKRHNRLGNLKVDSRLISL